MKFYSKSYYTATPAHIAPDEMRCWYDFSNPVPGTTFTEGQKIPTLEHQLNKGGGAFNASQSDSSKQGVYKIATTTAPSLRPILRTNGNQCYITPPFALNVQMTLFIAGYFAAAEADSVFVEFSPDATANDGFYFWGSDLNPNFFIKKGGNTFSVSGPSGYVPTAGFNVFVARYDQFSTAAQLYLRNVLQISASSSFGFNPAALNTLNIGSRNNAAGPQLTIGDWGELILYDIGLTDGQMFYIINYLCQKWLGVSL